MTAYPPQPWRLTGRCLVGVWLLRDAPAPDAPGAHAVRLLGRSVVAAAWFVYEEPSPLTYGEVMSTVLVRQGWRPRVSITRIWVDSPASLAGGRELWAIPKDLAEFEVRPDASYAARGVGRAQVRLRGRLPVSVPLGFALLQGRSGQPVVTGVRGRVRPALVRASWSFEPDGPLGFLAGRRPLLSLAASPFRLVFGARAS